MSGFDSKVLAELEREDPEEAQAYLEDLAAAEAEADAIDMGVNDDLFDIEMALHDEEELGEFDPFENF
jgi:hypothetical protein